MAKMDEPFAFSQGWYDTRSALIVEVETDEGITGFGEAFGPAVATRAIVDTILAPLITGMDPMSVEVVWERMYNKMRDYGQKGIPIGALSAIDVALWDIRGKATGQPIHKLLGGPFREQIQAYATGMYFTQSDNLLQKLVREAASYAAQGFSGVKVKIGWGPDWDIRLVREIRRELGPAIKLMIDANHAYNAATAVKVGLALEDCDITWFEEPVPPEDIAGYLQVKSKLSIPLAGGEAEFTRYGFRPLITQNAVDVVQPDCCLAGGLTECRYIAAMAHTWGIQCIPHVWGTAVTLAAAIQFISALPNCPPSLHPQHPMLELDRTPNPLREQLAAQPIEVKDGWVAVSTLPGLGIEIDREMLARWSVN
jgi:D-galactarolactone cycloisomerase